MVFNRVKFCRLNTLNFSHVERSENDQVVTSAGYELNLPGGLIESRSTLDKHLKSGWLDSMTRRLYVSFQMYNPNTDSVTVVEIRVTTECGIFYTISADVSINYSVSIEFQGRTRTLNISGRNVIYG